jgi:hypothetical protein
MSILTIALLAAATATAAATSSPAQEFPLTDTKLLVEHGVKAEAVDFLGRKAVRLIKSDAPGEAFGLLSGVEFQDGTIDADMAVKITTPPGVRMPGFIGIAFRVGPDAKAYDMFYIRPGNSVAEDQAMRNHAVQYTASPGYGWWELRRAWPWVYEAHAEIEKDAWTHLKIEVAGRVAKLYLNNSTKPALVVDGLKGPELRGRIGLMAFSGEEAYFSNVRVTSASPQPVKNGSDAAGAWDVKLSTDTGSFDGTLQLQREGNTLSGTWSGKAAKDLGKDVAVTGTWRDGYIELAFTGQWPKEIAVAPPADVKTTLAGWIDGASGKGRMKIEARADGTWSATRRAANTQ